MKKSLLAFSLLCVFLMILAGCSESNISSSTTPNNAENSNIRSNGKPERKSNTNEDDIKFLRIDWLTEKKEVDNIIDSKFGTEYQVHSGLNRYKNVFNVDYYNKENQEKSLLWEIGGQKINTFCLRYYTPDKGTSNYLWQAEIYFDNPSIDLYEDLTDKLNNLYEKTDTKFESYERDSYYTDKNNNTLQIRYFSLFDNTYVKIWYTCGEIEELLHNEYEIYENEYNEKKKEMQREQTPDL